MTTDAPYYNQLQSAFAEFDEYLSVDGDALIRFLVEEGILQMEQIKNIFNKIKEFFNWMLEVMEKFEGMAITADGLLALAEVVSEFLTYCLETVSKIDVSDLPDEISSHFGVLSGFTLPVDPTEVGKLFPGPQLLEELKNSLASLVLTIDNIIK